MVKPAPKSQDAYLHDMLEAARLIRGYVAGVALEAFLQNSEKRDAVALRISVLGESACKIDKVTEAALPGIPFKSLRGMRNRIAHDYGAVDFKIVWAVTQEAIDPLISALESYFKQRSIPGNPSCPAYHPSSSTWGSAVRLICNGGRFLRDRQKSDENIQIPKPKLTGMKGLPLAGHHMGCESPRGNADDR